MSGYTLHDHTADVMVQADGKTLEKAFEQAARGTFACMADLDQVEPARTIDIHVSADDLGSLLYDFIDELIYQRDVEGMLFSAFDVTIEENDGYRLTATLHGTDIGSIPARDVKAPTYSDMEIQQQDDGSYHVQLVLDV